MATHNHSSKDYYRYRIPGALKRARTFFTPKEKEILEKILRQQEKITGTFGTAYADEVV